MLGVTLVGVGALIALRALDVSIAVLAELARWAPALLLVLATWLLWSAVGPRRLTLAALFAAVLGGLGLVATLGSASAVFWWLVLAFFVACLGVGALRIGLTALDTDIEAQGNDHRAFRQAFRKFSAVCPRGRHCGCRDCNLVRLGG